MPEYLAPGVYVEETSFRAKSIEGVATSSCGFVGQARYGPIKGLPELVTSYEDFKRLFGDHDLLLLDGIPTLNHLAYAVRLFFENGGKRVYISRLYSAPTAVAAGVNADGVAESVLIAGTGATDVDRVSLRARFPGRAGNVQVTVRALRSGNLLTGVTGSKRLSGVRRGDVVEVIPAGGTIKQRVVSAGGAEAITPDHLYAISMGSSGQIVLTRGDGSILDVAITDAVAIQKITVDLEVHPNPDGSSGARSDLYQRMSVHADSEDFIGQVLRHDDRDGVQPPADSSQRIYLARGAGSASKPVPPFPQGTAATDALKAAFARDLLAALTLDSGAPDPDEARPAFALRGGSDGQAVVASDFDGSGEGRDAKGLKALAEIDDIAIVAAPGSAALADTERQAVTNALISHCENLRYRFAILAGPRDLNQTGIRAVRSQIDSKHAALYYPWLLLPPVERNSPPLALSPEGAMAGIYARSDIERGVHKAPANETVRGVLGFNRNVDKGEQYVLNPEGINCLRFFEGRGYRVWGARTISSDPEWVYVNVRRLFIFLEHSIDRSTQWAVFEPNNEELWLKIRLTIESFLYDVWRTGALLGSKPEDAYFVRCDRSTMSQGDLDNGRLICLIGVAPTKPAEFVIFRIGQWTADASII
ncbi:MAG: phage tail sheath subtilisin-like domain-containing protein [Cyanobium sp. M30B3]|nr:MAG: phage tail sheath subtilisin-like domain-containing protein [Cyanobium sp. M30B3]